MDCARIAVSMSLMVGLEAFSGRGLLARSFANLVGPFGTFEVNDDPSENLLTETGLHKLLVMLFRVKAGGHIHLGTPCKSWVVLSRAYTQRSILRPEGPAVRRSKRQSKYLDEHNGLASLSAKIIRTACIAGITFTIEQPVSSLLFHFPEMLQALAYGGAKSISCMMSSFEGDSPKPLSIRGNPEWLQEFKKTAMELARTKKHVSARLTTKGKRKDGGASFTGIRKALTASSGYTKEFGVAMALSFMGKNHHEIVEFLKEPHRH